MNRPRVESLPVTSVSRYLSTCGPTNESVGRLKDYLAVLCHLAMPSRDDKRKTPRTWVRRTDYAVSSFLGTCTLQEHSGDPRALLREVNDRAWPARNLVQVRPTVEETPLSVAGRARAEGPCLLVCLSLLCTLPGQRPPRRRTALSHRYLAPSTKVIPGRSVFTDSSHLPPNGGRKVDEKLAVSLSSIVYSRM